MYPNPGRGAYDSPPTAEDLWRFVQDRLGPFTADVALAVLAQLCEPIGFNRPKLPMLEPVRITADAVLLYKGIQRYGAERRLLYEQVCEAMESLRSLEFDADWAVASTRAGHAGYAGAPIACLTSSTSSYINPASLVARIASQLHGWCGQVSGQSGGSVPSRELGSAAWRECCSRWITDKTVLRIFWRRKLAFTSHYYPASRHARSRCSFESFSQTSVRCPSGLFAIVIGPGRIREHFDRALRDLVQARIFSKVEWPLG